jgi:hypothetical protein
MPRKIFSLLVLAIFCLPLAIAPARAATGREPVIVIPGMAGSELIAAQAFHLSVGDGRGGTFEHDYAAGEKVWVNVKEAAWPGEDDYFDALKLGPDGATPAAPALRVGGIYDSTYGDLVDYIERQGYAQGRDLWLFPYDWRRDIRHTAARLDGFVTTALVTANGGRADPATWTIRHVDIVAHSMGGLVGRFYVSDPARAARVDQLITFGSPQLGAAKFLKTLLYGDDFGSTVLGLGLNPDEVKDVVQNMPGGMELLPSRAYYSYYDNSDPTRLSPFLEERDVDADGITGGALSYTGVRDLMLNLHTNPSVIDTAERFGSGFDGLRVLVPVVAGTTAGKPFTGDGRSGGLNGVRWQALVGYGRATIGQVHVYTGVCGGQPCARREELPIDGDGTVGLYSAAMGDPQRKLFFTDAAALDFVEREHSGMIQRDYVLGVPTGDGPGLMWLGERLRDTGEHAVPGITGAPARGLSGIWISALGPLALRVADAEGHAIGRAPGSDHVVRDIPDASYDRLPEGEFVYLKRDAAYTLQAVAERAGSADLKLRVLDGGRTVRTLAIRDVAVGKAGRLRLELPSVRAPALADTGEAGPQLQVDADGDGTFERVARVVEEWRVVG